MSIRILLVDDHAMLRQGLKSLLRDTSDFEVIGEAQDGRTAVQTAMQLRPDVVVMDVRMPDLNGVDATRQLLAANPEVKVIALSSASDEQTGLAMLQAGASGYVVKDAAFEELADAVRVVTQGRHYLSPALTDRLSDRGVGANGVPGPSIFSVLSQREREVLQLIAEGRATKEIAADLSVSIKTVETHRRNMMEKLKLDSVAELTKYAIREGISSL